MSLFLAFVLTRWTLVLGCVLWLLLLLLLLLPVMDEDAVETGGSTALSSVDQLDPENLRRAGAPPAKDALRLSDTLVLVLLLFELSLKSIAASEEALAGCAE